MDCVKGPIGKFNKLLKKKFGRKRFLIPIYLLFLSITIGFGIGNILEFYGQKIATEILYKQQERIAIPEIVLCSSKWQNKTRMEEDGVSVELMEYLKFGFFSPLNYHPTNRRPAYWDLREAAFRTWLQNPKNRRQFGDKKTFDYANFFMAMSQYCRKFISNFRQEHGTREPGCSYFRKVLTDTGICMELKQHGQLSQDLPGSAGGIQFVSSVSNALEPPTLFHSSLEDGIHIHINGEWIPTINSAPTFIPAGSTAYMKLSVVRKTKILDCIPDEQKRRLVHFDREYSRVGCIYECAINRTLEDCGCTLFTYNIKLSPDKFCHPKIMKDCVKPIVEDNWSELMHSCTEKCLPNCVITRIDASVSYARNDKGKVAEYSRRFNKTWKANKSVSLLIYFGELSVTEINEFWTISLTTLLSNIGGQVGLWLGASVLGLVGVFMEWFPAKKIQKRKKTTARADDSHMSPSATQTV